MLDKDKLILVFYIGVKRINIEDVGLFLSEAGKSMSGYFDESVKCLFVPCFDNDNIVVKNVTDMPESGLEILEKINEAYLSKNKKQLEEYCKVLQDVIKTCKDGATS